MFINPHTAIEQGWVRGIQNVDKQVQPNAIDFTLDTLLKLNSATTPVISETNKGLRDLTSPHLTDEGWWLEHNLVYDGTSRMYVEIPEGISAVLYTRSTLVRNGVFLLSGLYDSGYKGHIGFTIYPIGGSMIIKPGTRIGQIAFLQADSAGAYAGGWNHTQDTHYTTRTN